MLDHLKNTEEWCKNVELMKEPWFPELDNARKEWTWDKVSHAVRNQNWKRNYRSHNLSVGDVVKSSVTGRLGVIIYIGPPGFFPWWVAWDDGDTNGGYQNSCFIWNDVGPSSPTTHWTG